MSDEQMISMWARWVCSILNDQQIGNKFGGVAVPEIVKIVVGCCGSSMHRHEGKSCGEKTSDVGLHSKLR